MVIRLFCFGTEVLERHYPVIDATSTLETFESKIRSGELDDLNPKSSVETAKRFERLRKYYAGESNDMNKRSKSIGFGGEVIDFDFVPNERRALRKKMQRFGYRYANSLGVRKVPRNIMKDRTLRRARILEFRYPGTVNIFLNEVEIRKSHGRFDDQRYQMYSERHIYGRDAPAPSSLGILGDDFKPSDYIISNREAFLDFHIDRLVKRGLLFKEIEDANAMKGWEKWFQAPIATRMKGIHLPFELQDSLSIDDGAFKSALKYLIDVVETHKCGVGRATSVEYSVNCLHLNTRYGFPEFKGFDKVGRLECLRQRKVLLEDLSQIWTYPISILARVTAGDRGKPMSSKQRSVKCYSKVIHALEYKYFPKLFAIAKSIPWFGQLNGERYVDKVQTAMLGVSISSVVPIVSLDVENFDDNIRKVVFNTILKPLFCSCFVEQDRPLLKLLIDYRRGSDYILPCGVRFTGRRGGVPSGTVFTSLMGNFISAFIVLYSAAKSGFPLKSVYMCVAGDDVNVVSPKSGFGFDELERGYADWGLHVHPDKTRVGIGSSLFCQIGRMSGEKIMSTVVPEGNYAELNVGYRSYIRHLNAALGHEFARQLTFIEESCMRIGQLESCRGNIFFLDIVYRTALLDPLLLGFYSVYGDPSSILRRVRVDGDGTLKGLAIRFKMDELTYSDREVVDLPVEGLQVVKALEFLNKYGVFDDILAEKRDGRFDYRGRLDDLRSVFDIDFGFKERDYLRWRVSRSPTLLSLFVY